MLTLLSVMALAGNHYHYRSSVRQQAKTWEPGHVWRDQLAAQANRNDKDRLNGLKIGISQDVGYSASISEAGIIELVSIEDFDGEIITDLHD